MSIWTEWAQRVFGPVRAQRMQQRLRANPRRSLGYEPLEARRVLTITPTFSLGVLTIAIDNNDTVAIGIDSGNVAINAVPISGPVLTSAVTSIILTSTNTFNNIIDLSGITQTDYSALLSVALDAGDGSDSYTFDQNSFLPLAVVSVTDTGASGSDQLTNNTTAAGPEQIGVSDTQITRDGGEPAINYTGIEVLNVNGTGAGDTLTDTTSVTAAETIGISSTQVTRSGSEATLNYSAISNLIVNGSATTGSDTINVTSTASGVATTVNAGAGDDIITVGNAGVLDGVLGALTVHGQAHTTADTLHLDDSAQASAKTYTLNAASFTRTGLATVNFDTVETVNLDAGTAGDTIDITGTASGVTTTVNAGAGDDNITVGSAGVLDGVLGTLNIHGQAHTTADTLHFDDSAQASAKTYTLNAASFTRTGLATVNFDTIETLNLDAGTAGDTINITGTASGVATTVNAGAGDDNITVGNASVLDGVLGALTIHGQAHTTADTLHLDDSAQASAKTYTLNSASFTRTGLATINFDTVETLNLDAGSAADTINITGTASGVATTVNAGAGDDNITVGNASVLDGVLGALTIHGQAHTTADTLHLDDSAQASAKTYTLNAASFTRTGLATVNFDTIETLNLDAGTAGDTINITGTASGVATTVNAGAGDDNITVGNASVLDGVLGALTIHGQAHTTADTLHLDDSAQASAKTYTLNSASFTRTGLATVNFDTVETVNLDAGTAGDTIDITGTASGVTTTVNAGAGDDNITVGSAGVLDGVLGTLNIHGQAHTTADTLHFDDSAQASAKTYTLNAASFTRTGLATVNFDTIETLNLDAGTAGDTINITGTASGVATTVNAGAGDDNITVGNASVLDGVLGALTIHGQAHTTADTLHLDDSAQASAKTYTLNSASFTRTGLATINFDTIETLNLDAGTAGDTINITGTASGVATTVNAGAGDDNITVGNASVLDGVLGALTIHGQAHTTADTLHLDDSAQASAKTYTLNSASFTRTGLATINFDTIETLNLDAGTAGDTINITGTASGVATTVNAGAGDDNITVGNASVLDGVLGALTIHGQAHTTADTLHLDDSAQASAQTYTLNAASFTRTGLATVNFDTVETVNLDAGTAGDTIDITGTASGVTTTVNAGAGDDNITVGSAGVLDGVLGTLNIHGQAHTTADTLHFDDSAQASAKTYTLNAASFTRTGLATVNFDTIETLNLDAGTAGDTINITGTASGVATTVNAGAGDDNITVGNASVLDGVLGALTIHGQAHTTADTLHLDDSAQASAKTYTLNSASFTRTGLATINFDTVETLNLDAGSAADTINITGTASGVATTVNAGAGDDNITVGNASVLDGVLGALTIHGQAHTTADTLHLDDSAQASAKTYTLNSASFTRTGLATINFDTIETLNLDAGTAGDTINITGTASGVATTVNAGAGDDNITVGNASVLDGVLGALTIHGQAHTTADTLHLDDSAQASAQTYTLNAASFTRTGLATVNFDTVETVNLDAGTAGDTIDITGTASGVTTTVNAGAGDDNITVGSAGVLDGVLGTLNIHGQAHTTADTLHFDDSAQASAKTYTLNAASFTRTGLATVNFDTIETLNLDAGTAGDTINITGTASGVATTVNAGAGDDNITVGNASVLDGVLGALTIHGQAHTTADTLHLDDSAQASAKTYTLNSASFTRTGLATINFDTIETLNLDAGTAGDTINITGTASGVATTVNAGAGDDNITVGNASVLDGVLGALTIHGQAHTTADTLHLDDSAQASAKTYTLNAASFTRTGLATINFDTIETLNLDAGSAADTIDVNGTPSGVAITLDGRGGGDTYNIIQSALGGPITVSDTGGAGIDTLFSTTTVVAGEQIGVSDTQITRDGGEPTITYSGLEALNVSGTAGTDTLTDTTSLAGPETIGVTSSTVTRNGGEATLTFSAIENLKVNGTAGADTFNVTGDPSGTTTLDGLGSADQYFIMQFGLPGPLTVADTGASGTDYLELNTTSPAGEVIGITSTTVARSTGSTVTYGGIESLAVNTSIGADNITINSTISGLTFLNEGNGNDTTALIGNAPGSNVVLHGWANDDIFNIRFVAAGSTVQVFGDTENDTFNIGNTSNKLDDIQGNLTISGGTHTAPGDALTFNDAGQTTNQTYTFTDTTLTRTGLPNPISFNTVETLLTNSGSANDKFVVNFSSYPVSPALTMKFDGGAQPVGGMDSVRLNGTAANNTMKVGTFGSGLPFQIQNIECLQLFGSTGSDNLENDTAVSSLIDGGDGADTLVGGSATDMIFGGDGIDFIYGRGGNDFLFGDHEFNNRSPRVKHAATGDKIFGDQGLFVGDPFASPAGVDKIVAIGSDTISAGGQIGDTIVGLGLHITAVDWLKARFLNPNGANIQAVINAALAQPCTFI